MKRTAMFLLLLVAGCAAMHERFTGYTPQTCTITTSPDGLTTTTKCRRNDG